jgi:hypothetical protein
VHYAGYRYFGWRIAHHRRQQYTAERVTEGVTIATLERLHDDLGVARGDVLNFDNARL